MDILFRFSYYPGISSLILLPALLTIPLLAVGDVGENHVTSGMLKWWVVAWTVSTIQPLLSRLTNKISGQYSSSNGQLFIKLCGNIKRR